tara:strand:+ start:714 stop:1151 length:438 start_codon:yes stop_codon:yes gene_type:complete
MSALTLANELIARIAEQNELKAKDLKKQCKDIIASMKKVRAKGNKKEIAPERKCKGIKNDGKTQCSFQALDGEDFCGIHKKKSAKPKVVVEKCKALTKKGKPCSFKAQEDSEYCSRHEDYDCGEEEPVVNSDNEEEEEEDFSDAE